jgi:hypothetical protein
MSARDPWPYRASVLAAYLAENGVVAGDVARALGEEASARGLSFVGKLVERNLVAPSALRDAMATAFELPLAKLAHGLVDTELLARFPADAAREYLFFPLARNDTRLTVAVVDPTLEEPLLALRNAVGVALDLRLAAADEVAPLVDAYFAPTLVARLPSGETVSVSIRAKEFRIGSAGDNDLVLSSPSVCRSHAFIRSFDGGYQVVDIESRSGVFVGPVRVDGSVTLRSGDVIRIGDCCLTFLPPVAEAGAGATGRLAAGAEPREDAESGARSEAKLESDGGWLHAAWIGLVRRFMSSS